MVAADKYVVAYVPAAAAAKLGLDVQSVSDQAQLKSYFVALDEGQAMGSAKLSEYDTWYFTSDTTFDKDGVRFTFDQVINGNVYASVIGVDGSDLTDSERTSLYMKPSFGGLRQANLARRGEHREGSRRACGGGRVPLEP